MDEYGREKKDPYDIATILCSELNLSITFYIFLMEVLSHLSFYRLSSFSYLQVKTPYYFVCLVSEDV